ncbi:MAG: adenosyl-hopene transferase HpnH [Pseudomonadota bacterium]
MRFPLSLYKSLIGYLARKKLSGQKRFPLVLMLEPTHQCNLACNGCGRIREYHDSISQQMSLGECLGAVEECGVPVVSICGGEPLLYRHITELVDDLTRQGKHVYLCTNGLLMKQRLSEFTPSSRLIWSVHLDGPREVHDSVVNRQGVYAQAMEAIAEARRRGFLVCTNTTVYKESEPAQLNRLFNDLERLDISGLLVSPGYSFSEANQDLFLSRQEVMAKFKEILPTLRNHRYWNSPLYLRFLTGERQLQCSPWGNPCVNPQGWRGPCYLTLDRHYPSYRELMRGVDWPRFERQQDPRCRDCMVHCGFEPSAVFPGKLGDMLEMVKWNLT